MSMPFPLAGARDVKEFPCIRFIDTYRISFGVLFSCVREEFLRRAHLSAGACKRFEMLLFTRHHDKNVLFKYFVEEEFDMMDRNT